MFDKEYEKKINAIIAKNLNIYMELRGVTQADLARYMNVSTATTSNWCNGIKLPRMDKIDRICGFLHIKRSDLMEEKTTQAAISTTVKAIRIPVLGKVAAGIPIDAVEDILDYEEITPDMAARGEHFGLVIKGNSMEPRMCEGDVVIVRQQSDCDSGDVAIVMINGDEATCKKVMKYENGSIALVSNNPAYPPMVYTPEQAEQLPLRIIGKVVELRGKF